MKKTASKAAPNGPYFFSVLSTGPKSAQISYSVLWKWLPARFLYNDFVEIFVCRIDLTSIYEMKFKHYIPTLFMLETFLFLLKTHCVTLCQKTWWTMCVSYVGMWRIKVHVASFNITYHIVNNAHEIFKLIADTKLMP